MFAICVSFVQHIANASYPYVDIAFAIWQTNTCSLS